MTKSENKFSHIDAGGQANMVDVSDKSETKREAVAEGFENGDVGVRNNVGDPLQPYREFYGGQWDRANPGRSGP